MNQDNQNNQNNQNQVNPQQNNFENRPKTEEELFREEIVNFFSKYNVHDNETLTSKEIINLAKKENTFKSLNSLSTEKLDVYIDGMASIASSDKHSENMRLHASMVMLEVSGFFYKSGDAITDYEKHKRNEFKDHDSINKSLNKLLNDPIFVHENRDLIKSILQNQSHPINAKLTEIVSNNDMSNRIFKINYLENKILEKEIENLNRHIQKNNLTEDEKIYYKEKIEAKRKEIQEINILNSLLPHKDLAAIENDKLLTADMKKFFNDRKGDYYQSPELITLIRTKEKANEVSEAEALYYHYISQHQKRIDSMKKYGASIKDDLKYKIFSSKDEDYLQYEGKSLYSKAWKPIDGIFKNTSTYEVPPSKFKDIIIKDIIDKILLKNHLSTVNISFGSNVQEEEREKTAMLAIKEMRDFLIKHPNFKNEKQVIEQIEKSLKVEGMDTKDLINKAFPQYKEQTLIEAVEPDSPESKNKTFIQLKEESMILMEKMEDPVQQSTFFKKVMHHEIMNFLSKDNSLSPIEKNQIKEDIEQAIKNKDYISMVEIMDKVSKINPDFETSKKLDDSLQESIQDEKNQNKNKNRNNRQNPDSPKPKPQI